MIPRPDIAIPRRTLLGMASCAAVLPASAARAADKPPFTLGIQLYSLRGYAVPKALEHAKDLGFQMVEFWRRQLPITSTAEEIATVRRQVADLGLSISGHGVHPFGKDAAANRQVFAFAKAAGIRMLTADPEPESFANLEDLVKEFDIRVAIHNHGPGHRYARAIDVLRAIENRDERIGACADLGHFIRAGERPVEVIRVLAGRLHGIHLKDFATMEDKAKGVVLGKGHLDPAAVFAALVKAGFPADGALSLEYEENPENPLAEIRECVDVARKALAAT